MANLSDAKEISINVNSGNQSQPVKKAPFIPTVTMDTDSDNNAPDPNIGKPNYQNKASVYLNDTTDSSTPAKPVTISMINNKGNNSTRHKADFSSIPKQSTRAEIGIDKRKSITDDVFGAGGPFEKMKDRKIKEYKEEMNKIDLINLEKKQGEDLENVDLDNTSITSTTNFKEVDMIDINIEDEKDEETMSKTNGIEGLESVTGFKDVIDEKLEEQSNIEEKRIKNITNAEANKAKAKEDEIKNEEEKELEDGFADTDSIEFGDDDDDLLEADPDEDDPKENIKFADSAAEIIDVKEESVPITINNTPSKDQIADINASVESGDKKEITLDEFLDDESDEVPDSTINNLDKDEDEKKNLAILKDEITKKLKPVCKKYDLSTFTIASKSTRTDKIIANESASVAKWVLPATGITFKMREISGSNLELLRADIESDTPNIRSALKIIYDHIISQKSGFDTWLKSISYADYDHLFMGMYIAAFSDSNYIPIDCQHEGCGKTYLTDNIPMKSMIHFKDNASKVKFNALYNSDIVEPKDGYNTTTIMAISNKFAIGFKEPDLYSALIEPGYFRGNANFIEKYGITISYLPYISNIYYIDPTAHTLVPIDYTHYESNISKTARSRVQRYDKIINTFSIDETAYVGSAIKAIADREPWFTYCIPETTCPYCGSILKESDGMTALSLVFLRNRLGILATI